MISGRIARMLPEERLQAVMTVSLEMIVTADRQARPPGTLVRHWDVPEADRLALVQWGLPTGLLMRPRFQAGPDPTLVPNVAGEIERRHISPDQRLYDLGQWGDHDLTPQMGAVAGEGRVLAVRPAPLTSDELPPRLREHYRGLYRPAVDFINSSVAQLIEVAWRWRAAREAFLALEEPDWRRPEDERDAHVTELNAYRSRVKGCQRIVVDHIQRIDSRVRAEDPGSLWGQVVTDAGL